jgi:hypothetical protein
MVAIEELDTHRNSLKPSIPIRLSLAHLPISAISESSSESTKSLAQWFLIESPSLKQ